jgi:hypothetical protein
MKTILIIVGALALGAYLGASTYSVPLRTFSVDNLGNQHCQGLRHGEKFEVFCLSTERAREQTGRYWPSTEDHRAPWAPGANPQPWARRLPER